MVAPWTSPQHNSIIVYIPPFTASGTLPPGIHVATWTEVAARYGWTPRRRWLLEGLRTALVMLRYAGCQTVYVNGSFVTAKEVPEDFDVCWNAIGVDPERVDPVLLTFGKRRATQRAKYGGEFFPAHFRATSEATFLEFFQIDRRSGDPKGIVSITLASVPDDYRAARLGEQ